MKKILVVLLVIAIAMIGASSAMALVADSKHNLSSTGQTTAYRGTTTETCVFCHTPHSGLANNVLWNRSNPLATTFTTYLTTKNSTLAAQGSLNGGSLNCLSCHDGVTALGGAIINQPGSGLAGGSVKTGLATVVIGPGATLIGQNLGSTHPIGIVYTGGTAITGKAGLRVPTSDTILDGTVRLMTPGILGILDGPNTTGTVQCVSCHNPHNYTASAIEVNFLRVTNADSGMCVGCHSYR